MNRLTIKDKTSLNYKLDYGSLYGTCGQEIYDKLGQLEDIEDELGIDLITYVKATTQPVLYIKNTPFDNEIKQAFLTCVAKNDTKPIEYFVFFDSGGTKRHMFNLKDYGKTWALTKEELENEN